MLHLFPIAHGSIEGLGDLWNGVLHPLRSPAQVLVLLGLGLFAGQRRRLRPLAVSFLWASAAGFGLNLVWRGIPEPPVFLLCVVSAFLGVWVAIRKPMPTAVAKLLFAVAGWVLAWDSLPEADSLWSAFKVSLGVWVGLAVILLNLGSYAQMAPKKGWVRTVFRVLGSWIMAISVLYLALSLRR
jgi:hydrogenase/urease accessory protein HupE